jgi:beta-glucosidase
MKRLIIALAVTILASCGGKNGGKLPDYLNDKKPVEVRIEDALGRMTLEEKIAMLHAQSKFSSPGVPRLGIPGLNVSDGPHGVREEIAWERWESAGRTDDSCTAFPALTCLAATWDVDLAALYGRSIGEEARFRGKDVLLGPGVNIYRTPLGGRNFEYMGEDPFLASQMVVPYVRGVQSQGVAACVKHFALNNQENDRLAVNVSVSDRALHEIYLPAFRAAVVDGGAWAIMGAYNRYKDQHCCHNEYLLNTVLKGEWNFDGTVLSDWGGTHDTREAAMNGLDIEFGTWFEGSKGDWDYDNYYMARPLLELVRSGEIDESVVDGKVRRILRLIFRTSMDRSRPFGSFASPEHFAASRAIAEAGVVLLKNDHNSLPVSSESEGTILVVGENAVRRMTVGGGSSELKTKYEITPLEGLRARFGDRVQYMRGYESSDRANGDGALAVPGTEAGAYAGDETGVGAFRHAEPLSEVVEAAARAEIVLFFGGLNKTLGQDCEGGDRASMALPYGQDELIAALAAANPRTAVVIMSGNAVAMPWRDAVPAIVQGWYLGSEAGSALAAVIAGDVNPSGKLPFTYYSSLTDCGAHVLGDYPGAEHRETYMDDIWVGYRYTDKKGEGAAANFPFGHGLSYTTFEYSAVEGDKEAIAEDGSVRISVRVRNTGSRTGAEVVQLYIGDAHASVARPIKELKGFQKVVLEPGHSTKVTFVVKPEALSFYDETRHRWVVEKGNFTAYVGASATDIKGLVEFSVL